MNSTVDVGLIRLGNKLVNDYLMEISNQFIIDFDNDNEIVSLSKGDTLLATMDYFGSSVVVI